MVKVTKQDTPLVTQPLKTSPATGATLASMGFQRTIPLMHGSQGCGAFAKVFLIQHLREPIPLQNTAIDQVSAVMGGDENLYEALKLLCEKQGPDMISVMTTGLTEMQGSDIYRVIATFKQQNPQFAATRIVSIHTPDFIGSMQTGYVQAVDSTIRQLVQEPTKRDKQRKQVNVLCSIGCTAADIETLRRYIEAFNLDAVFIPDLSLSLDGHLADPDFSATSTGGTSVLEVEMMSESDLTIVVGPSFESTAKWLNTRFNIPYVNIGMGMTINQTDELIMTLSKLSRHPVPAWITRARKRLQDAMLDSHFLLTNERFVIALEPDLASGYCQLLDSIGTVVSQIVTTVDHAILEQLPAKSIEIGDLSRINMAGNKAKLLISNTHAAHVVEPGYPVLRAGYPCHDQFGNMDIKQLGYEGCRERLFALANLLLRHHVDEVAPHISRYRFDASEVTQKGAA
ncbi:nitrogenase iron-molybdenum cofactor biosynthesis protein NifN [Vibrio viridaestus]|uniref:Nitrogenase iron-molybdenum cofactor biosynthesis protein NifN n=1 Tax=Vibrio viridaestus TaxID=2487322 RepID=A0A3N9TYT9_9VIBR|nr:nitrogenase iron-molybdenum cofactor biosynthesis protein NifN [Vibrio viridaestus]RQW62102.1 nitrogenase iron-molybdenum cofactor biosynthesis protein NifN [Vibrio viridaestus]